MAKPLTELLKKDQLFVWTPVHEHAFNLLKQALSTAPVLALPNFSLPFHIETDASGTGVGAVLHQQGHPIAFISKPLSPKNQRLTVYEKEYLAWITEDTICCKSCFISILTIRVLLILMNSASILHGNKRFLSGCLVSNTRFCIARGTRMVLRTLCLATTVRSN